MTGLAPIISRFVNFKPGPPSSLFLDNRTILPNPDHYLLRVKAIGINRAECLQRQGKYKSSKPEDDFLGLEASGEVYDPLTREKLFNGIALLSGGSYSEWASVPRSHVIPLPPNLSFAEGAAIPEAWLTAFQLLRIAQAAEGHHIAVYAAASGVGTALIQLCSLLGAKPYAVVSGEEKAGICKELGAAGVVHYRDNPNWAA